MRKSLLPWHYALTGVIAISMMAPVTAAAAADPAQAPQASATSAKRVVTGVVVDAVDGEPLPGATVSVRGDKSAITATDIDGNFSITIPNNKAMLVVSYVGYKEFTTPPVDDLGFIKIELKGDEKTLDEVVVVGAGTQTRVSVTGAIQSVKGEELRMPATTLTNALAGKIAGVVAMSNSGEPGQGAEFYIRGISTFGGRATPLILLDDVEISASDLDYVPAENIESFSILKDASATAIYGARGANGVMIVKTKGGDYNAKTTINVSFENSFNFLDKFPEFVDGPTYMKMHNKARESRNLAPLYSEETINKTIAGRNPYLYPNVNWTDVIFKDMAMRQRANVNVSGGGSKVRYYMSLDFQHEDGLINTDKLYSWNNNVQIYNYTFQNNIAYKLTPTTTITMNMNAQIRQTKRPNTGNADNWAQNIFNMIHTTSPVGFPKAWPAQEGDEYVRYATQRMAESYLQNPYARLNTSYYEANGNTLNTVIKVNQDFDFITKGLKAEVWVNFKNWSQSSFDRSVTPYYFDVNNPGSYDEEIVDRETGQTVVNTTFPLRRIQEGTVFINQSALSLSADQTFEFQANVNWNRKFGMHDVSVMALYRMRQYRNAVLPNRNQGVSFRATYDFAHRYLVEFNAGYNGTERLAKKDRFGFFPAASIGWVISNEPFFEPASSVVSNLKIRASYGLVGSDDLAKPAGSYFLYIDQIQDNAIDYLKWSSGYYGGAGYQRGGPMLTYYAAPGIGWEKSRKADVGLDVTLWGDLSIVADVFYDQRYDIFLKREAWPQSLAYHEAKPWSNKGKMDNKGLELSVDYAKRINNDWSFSVKGTFTYNENKYVDWDEPLYPYTWSMTTGLPYSRTTGYIAEGLFKSQEEIDNSPEQRVGAAVPMVGDVKYRDINGDGVINDDDQTMISPYGRIPRIQYGFGGTLNWKKFDFGFQFTGSAKRTILMNGIEPFQEGRGGSMGPQNMLTWIADNYFDPVQNNFDAKYPRLGTQDSEVKNNYAASTYWMRDGQFLRLRNVELGWSFPYGRVYVTGSNLFCFSPFKLWDPELKAWNAYPLQKSVTVGVKLTI
ncbi:MAG: TonB-dependent receptor [Muribaculaceae bacterium]|nr:TonB-dependent receptor [Muribaculaceae bacterium]